MKKGGNPLIFQLSIVNGQKTFSIEGNMSLGGMLYKDGAEERT